MPLSGPQQAFCQALLKAWETQLNQQGESRLLFAARENDFFSLYHHQEYTLHWEPNGELPATLKKGTLYIQINDKGNLVYSVITPQNETMRSIPTVIKAPPSPNKIKILSLYHQILAITSRASHSHQTKTQVFCDCYERDRNSHQSWYAKLVFQFDSWITGRKACYDYLKNHEKHDLLASIIAHSTPATVMSKINTQKGLGWFAFRQELKSLRSAADISAQLNQINRTWESLSAKQQSSYVKVLFKKLTQESAKKREGTTWFDKFIDVIKSFLPQTAHTIESFHLATASKSNFSTMSPENMFSSQSSVHPSQDQLAPLVENFGNQPASVTTASNVVAELKGELSGGSELMDTPGIAPRQLERAPTQQNANVLLRPNSAGVTLSTSSVSTVFFGDKAHLTEDSEVTVTRSSSATTSNSSSSNDDNAGDNTQNHHAERTSVDKRITSTYSSSGHLNRVENLQQLESLKHKIQTSLEALQIELRSFLMNSPDESDILGFIGSFLPKLDKLKRDYQLSFHPGIYTRIPELVTPATSYFQDLGLLWDKIDKAVKKIQEETEAGQHNRTKLIDSLSNLEDEISIGLDQLINLRQKLISDLTDMEQTADSMSADLRSTLQLLTETEQHNKSILASLDEILANNQKHFEKCRERDLRNSEENRAQYLREIKELGFQPLPTQNGHGFLQAIACLIDQDPVKLGEHLANTIAANPQIQKYLSLPRNLTLSEYLSQLKTGSALGNLVEIAVIMETYQRRVFTVEGSGGSFLKVRGFAPIDGLIDDEHIFIGCDESQNYFALSFKIGYSADSILKSFRRKNDLILGRFPQNITNCVRSIIKLSMQDILGGMSQNPKPSITPNVTQNVASYLGESMHFLNKANRNTVRQPPLHPPLPFLI